MNSLKSISAALIILATLTHAAVAGPPKSFKSMGRSISGMKSMGSKSFGSKKSFAHKNFTSRNFTKQLSPRTSNKNFTSRNFNQVTRNLGKGFPTSQTKRQGKGIVSPTVRGKITNNIVRNQLPKAISSKLPGKVSNRLTGPVMKTLPHPISKQWNGSQFRDAVKGIVDKNVGRPALPRPIVDRIVNDGLKGKMKDLVDRGVIGTPSKGQPHDDRHDDRHDHPHKYKRAWQWIKHLHKPVCLPPIVRCPPPAICPPSVLAVCPHAQVIHVERTTHDVLVDFLEPPTAPAFVLDLESNAEVSLEIDGLTGAPGALVLEVNEIGLPVEVLLFEDGLLHVRVPSVGLGEPKLGKLYVLNAEFQLVASVDARLHPGQAAAQ